MQAIVLSIEPVTYKVPFTISSQDAIWSLHNIFNTHLCWFY